MQLGDFRGPLNGSKGACAPFVQTRISCLFRASGLVSSWSRVPFAVGLPFLGAGSSMTCISRLQCNPRKSDISGSVSLPPAPSGGWHFFLQGWKKFSSCIFPLSVKSDNTVMEGSFCFVLESVAATCRIGGLFRNRRERCSFVACTRVHGFSCPKLRGQCTRVVAFRDWSEFARQRARQPAANNAKVEGMQERHVDC